MGGYKEYKSFNILDRKNIIIRYTIGIILIFAVMVTFIGQLMKENKKYSNVTYAEESNLNYKVYLKENNFFDKNYLKEENQYIAALIEFIETEFSYELKASKTNIDYKYAYKILAEIIVEDKTNHKTLYTFDEELVKYKEYDYNTNSKLSIKENVKLNYNKYNDVVKEFIDLYDLELSNAFVKLNMYVDIQCNDQAQWIKSETPVISMNIPLATDTMSIDMETNDILSDEVTICESVNKGKYVFGLIISTIIELLLIVNLVIFVKDTKDEKTVYQMLLRKIMSNFGSYIQKLYNEFDFTGYQILEVKSFQDLLQIKDNLNTPILMTEMLPAMETYFFITNEKICYMYELKAGNFKRNRAKRYKSRIEETRNYR